MCKYREYGTSVNAPSCPNYIPVPLSVSRFHFSALTTIHCQVKLQISMQVVTCEKIKMFGGLSLFPGIARLMKPRFQAFLLWNVNMYRHTSDWPHSKGFCVFVVARIAGDKRTRLGNEADV